MSEPFSTYRIGIDGGGTRCRFALTTPETRYEEVLGSANVHTDQANAIRVLRSGLTALAMAAGLPHASLRSVPAYAGLAGASDAEAARTVQAALEMDHLVVEDDMRSTLTGALGTEDGVVAGIGTGSFLARQADGDVRSIGGHGAELGDEASGCWLGRLLLARVLHVRDGLVQDSPLVSGTRDQFGGKVERILAFAKDASPSRFAELAPKVVEAAGAGDRNGVDLMRLGARYIETGIDALGRQEGETVCLTGGLGRHYAAYLPDRISGDLKDPAGTALDGALMLAGLPSIRKQRVAS